MLIIFSYIYDLQIMFTIEPRPSPKCAMTAEAGGRNVDRMQQPCCMEDGGRPSGGGLQDQPSNHTALRGDKLLFLAKITIGCRIKYINRVSNSALSHVKLALCSDH